MLNKYTLKTLVIKRLAKRLIPILFVLLFIAGCRQPSDGSNDRCGTVLATRQPDFDIIADGQFIVSDNVSYLLRLDNSLTYVAKSVTSSEATFPDPGLTGVHTAIWLVSGCPGTNGQVQIRGPVVIALE